MNPNAWKIIPKGEIVLNFSNCKNADDIHDRVKSGLGFPDYYGENWDALWDCLRDFANSQKSLRKITVKGFEGLSNDLNEYLQEAIEIFKELEEKYPVVHFVIEK